jgi:hypothetical protein
MKRADSFRGAAIPGKRWAGCASSRPAPLPTPSVAAGCASRPAAARAGMKRADSFRGAAIPGKRRAGCASSQPAPLPTARGVAASCEA